MIKGTTKNLGVMGWPIAHSLSPVLQNAAIEEAGLDYVYISLPVPPEKLKEAVAGLRAMQFTGWNVTIPHKQAIMAELDAVDEDARIIGAVNTVVNRDGHLTGYNTDCIGFMQPLAQQGFLPKGKEATILGAGGAARAVIWGLLRAKVKRITLGVRNPAKAARLAEEFAAYGEIQVLHWEDSAFAEHLAVTDLLVNTTPLGMYPHVEGMPPVDWTKLKKDALVYDIIYTPERTRFLSEAQAHGHAIINGEGMLAGQGEAAFTLWTGVAPDLALMKRALREELDLRQGK
ncbi:shikimate dehydrogenase [Mitsuokella multacida]|uniref:shikimate dehydrogenase n=1 Tax=Mitsuokella multacida TaxID=52226 RepID=UPI001F29BD46|nr:shikimate dehydrogenase [Mitsuokella multacida]MCF2584655.1 shikimate dehydrogenase [Mitsuokella multacida]